jgi:hypothetical protein
MGNYIECLEGPNGCHGEVAEYPALSGSGMVYGRCEFHYESYVSRVQPRIDDINRRYPRTAPRDFDPAFAGERWNDED